MSNLSGFAKTVSLVAILCLSQKASAQLGGGRIDRPLDIPTFSPYINLLRDNGSPGLNYFGLVRPQLEFAQQNQQLGQNFQALQMQQGQQMRMTGGYGYSQLGVTGHPVVFNSFGGGRFGGGYTGAAAGGGGFGGGGQGGGFGAQGGGLNGGFNQFGGQGIAGPGGAGFGFSGVSGHAAQFGGIGNSTQGLNGGR